MEGTIIPDIRVDASAIMASMNPNELVQRCRICDSPVYEKLVKGEMTLADVRPPIEVVRVCQNPRCPSNIGDMSIADEV